MKTFDSALACALFVILPLKYNTPKRCFVIKELVKLGPVISGFLSFSREDFEGKWEYTYLQTIRPHTGRFET